MRCRAYHRAFGWEVRGQAEVQPPIRTPPPPTAGRRAERLRGVARRNSHPHPHQLATPYGTIVCMVCMYVCMCVGYCMHRFSSMVWQLGLAARRKTAVVCRLRLQRSEPTYSCWPSRACSSAAAAAAAEPSFGLISLN